jgi:hypothetical protein
LASALGAISDSSAHFIAAATGATDRNLPSRHFLAGLTAILICLLTAT